MIGMRSFQAMMRELLAGVGITLNGPEAFDPQVHDDRFYLRLMLQGSLGLGESYMDGWWACDQLDEFFRRVIRLQAQAGHGLPGWIGDMRGRFFNLQTRRRARQVADEHYNFDNRLFEVTLGPTMGYTCGYWRDTTDPDQAQRQKFDLVCRKLALQPGQRLLEIGCGWGGLLSMAAAQYGVEAVGITNSEEQLLYARCRTLHLPVEVRLADYRDLPYTEEFDAVAVVGMIEHVGHRNHRRFMAAAHRALKPGGLFLLHTIGNHVSRWVTEPWMNRYIFPNGLIPSEVQIARAREGLFVTQDLQNFGLYYDPTLMAWWRNFEEGWGQLRGKDPVKYDERFYRMWRYYLLSCAGAFRAGNLQLWQYVFSKGPRAEVYQAVR